MKKLIWLLALPLYAQPNPQGYNMQAPGPSLMPGNQISVTTTPNASGAIEPKYYYIQVNYPIGTPGLSGPLFIANSPNFTYGGSDVLNWPAQPNAISYDVLWADVGQAQPTQGGSGKWGAPGGIGLTTNTYTANTTGVLRTTYTPASPVQPGVCSMITNNILQTYPYIYFTCPLSIPSIPSTIDCSNINYLDPAQAAIAQTQCQVNNVSIRSSDFCNLSQVNGVNDNTACLQAFLNALAVNPSNQGELVAPISNATTTGQAYGYVCTTLNWGIANQYTTTWSGGQMVKLHVQKGAYPSCAIPPADFAHVVSDDTSNPLVPFPSDTQSLLWIAPESGTFVPHGTSGEVAYFNTGNITTGVDSTLLFTSQTGVGEQFYRWCVMLTTGGEGSAGTIQVSLNYTGLFGSQSQNSPVLTLGGGSEAQANACYMIGIKFSTQVTYTVTLAGGGGHFLTAGVLEQY